MNTVFYISAATATAAAILAISRRNAVHALLWTIVSLLATAVVLFVLGAPLLAALEVIIYAGAILVLFVFAIMMLNVGPDAARAEALLSSARVWLLPVLVTGGLLAELIYVLHAPAVTSGVEVLPREVGVALLGTYALAVELAAMLLLTALVGAFHLGRRHEPPSPATGRAGGAAQAPAVPSSTEAP